MEKIRKSTPRIKQMMKTTQVSVMSVANASATEETKAFPAGAEDASSKAPRLMKLLTALCVGQTFLVIITMVVFGVFLHAQNNKIAELQEQKDVTEGTMAFVQDYNSRFVAFEDELTEIKRTVETMVNKMTLNVTNGTEICTTAAELEAAVNNTKARLQETEIKVYETRISMREMETDITELESNVMEIETRTKGYSTKTEYDNVNITLDKHSSQIANLESKVETNENRLLTHSQRLETLEALLDRCNLSLAMNTEILNLKSELLLIHFDIDANTEMIQQLKENLTENNNVTAQNQWSMILELNKNTTSLKDLFENQSDMIAQLQIDAYKQNSSLQNYILRLENIERKNTLDGAFVANNTLMIEEIQLRLLSYNTTIQTQNELLLSLEAGISVTQQTLQNHSNKLSELGTTYVRWGRTVCPNDADTVYKGYVGGAHYSHTGSGSNTLCLVEDPEWGHFEGSTSDGARLFGAEYRMGYTVDDGASNFFGDNLQHMDAVCVVCRIPRTLIVMIPARKTCYQGWNLEYRFVCVYWLTPWSTFCQSCWDGAIIS